MDEVRERVPSALDGERIDRVVAMLTEVSRAEATDLVRAGAVTIDGRPARRGADRIREGQELVIDVPPSDDNRLPSAEIDVEVSVVHVDEHLVIVDKPADLVVHPGAGHIHGTLVSGLLARFPDIAGVGDPHRPGIVHRLDRGTSGLLVVARSTVAHQALVAQLAARTVQRRYQALVWGYPESPRGLIDAPIGRSPKHPTKMAVTTQGKDARTRYEVEKRFAKPGETALVTCSLETGRTHQIRVHLAAIGHPVVGDDRYGGARQSLPLHRPFLHAGRLGFDHPSTCEALAFEANLPPDLEAALDALG
ncbi:RluA family pseudouridine synthase [soil metagenome]